MITYAIKVEERMTETNPQYKGEPVVLYYYLGKGGWMAGQYQYEGYETKRGAKIALSALKKNFTQSSPFWLETIIGIVPMNGDKEIEKE